MSGPFQAKGKAGSRVKKKSQPMAVDNRLIEAEYSKLILRVKLSRSLNTIASTAIETHRNSSWNKIARNGNTSENTGLPPKQPNTETNFF